jgi:hypothetical protein
MAVKMTSVEDVYLNGVGKKRRKNKAWIRIQLKWQFCNNAIDKLLHL